MSVETREGQPENIPELISEQSPMIFAVAALGVDNMALGRELSNIETKNIDLAFNILDNDLKTESPGFSRNPKQTIFWGRFFEENDTAISGHINLGAIHDSRDILMLKSFFVGALKTLYATQSPEEYGLLRDNLRLLSEHIARNLE